MIYEMIDILCQSYTGLSPVVLWEMWIEDFFDLWTDFVIFKRRENDEKDDSKTQIIFVPAKKSIAETGLY